MEHGAWLTGSLVYLGRRGARGAAGAAARPRLDHRLPGCRHPIGPWGLKLVTDPQDMLHFAEFGVVLMLFLVGLELEPRRLWALRKPIFGWGSVQLFGSAALMLGVGRARCGVDWRLALVAALGLAMSSTAIGLGVLAERNLMAHHLGPERAQRGAAAGHRRDPDPRAACRCWPSAPAHDATAAAGSAPPRRSA